MLISFILPAYKALYLQKAIQSIVGQTVSNWELVIVDDCSPYDLKSIVETFHDTRITYYRNKNNIGGSNLVKQWNHSISFAKGEWIVLAGDDDIYDTRFCEEVTRLATKYPDISLIRSRVEQIGPEGEHIGDDNVFPEFTKSYEFLSNWMQGKAFTCVGNYAFRRENLIEEGGFIEFPCGFCSDVATPINLSKAGVANTSEQLFKFRQSPYHLSGDLSRLGDKLEATTLFYDWLESFELPKPENDRDASLYSIKNPEYIHAKCIYDYFNHVLNHLPFFTMICYLKNCRKASIIDKTIMVLRWIKKHIVKH